MELEGHVENGRIVLNSPTELPEGAAVRVEIIRSAPPASLGERLRLLAEEFEKQPCDLPDDLSINHDHYLYGTPKRQP
jgi:hypothetical protein